VLGVQASSALIGQAEIEAWHTRTSGVLLPEFCFLFSVSCLSILA